MGWRDAPIVDNKPSVPTPSMPSWMNAPVVGSEGTTPLTPSTLPPSSTPSPTPEANDRWGMIPTAIGRAGRNLTLAGTGIADLLTIPGRTLAAGAAGLADALGYEDSGFRDMAYRAATNPGFSDLAADQIDTATGGALQPKGIVDTGFDFVAQTVPFGAGAMSKAITNPQTMRQGAGTVAKALDEALVQPYRTNPTQAAAIEGTSAFGGGAAQSAVDNNNPLEGTYGEIPLELLAALGGASLAPAVGSSVYNTGVKQGAKLVNTGAEVLGRQAPFEPQAAGGIERNLAEMLIENGPYAQQSFDAVNAVNQQIKDLGISEKGVVPTVGDILNDNFLLNLEQDAIKKRQGSPAVRERITNNEALVEKLAQEQGRQFDVPGANELDFGPKVREALQPEFQAEQDTLQQPARIAQQQLEQTVQNTVGDRIAPERAGQVIREDVLEPSITKMEDKIKETYAPIDAQNKLRVPLPETRKVAEQQVQRAAESPYPTLSSEDVRAAEATLKRTSPPEQGAAPVKPSDPTFTVSSVLNSISDIKRELRRQTTINDPGRSVKALNENLTATETDFQNALKGVDDDQLRTTLTKGRELRALKAKVFEQGAIGDVLKTQQGGRFKVAERDVLPSLLSRKKVKTPDDVKMFTRILDMPEFGAQKIDVRRGLSELYAERVIKDGKVNPAKHREFITEYADAIDSLWGDQAPTLKKVGALADNLAIEEKKAQDSLNTLKRTFKADLAGEGTAALYPENIYRAIATSSKDNRLANISSYKKITETRHPELWKEFQSIRRQELIDGLRGPSGQQKVTGNQNKLISFEKIDNVLSDTKQLEELSIVYGDDYVNALRELSDGIKVIRRNFDRTTEDVNRSRLGQITNYMRIWAPPLSTKGRILTAVKGSVITGQQFATEQVLSDANKIRELAEIMKKSYIPSTQRRALKFLGSIGVTDDLMDFDNESSPENE